ncbi:hypothetical protein [Thalassococcus sp. S3]|uniref:hypothetical protein n=1 Tax=Thalassococcus sp. S3 TaxID=2017482 RepID=UPI00102ADF4A|nr:hypothetical protein [Thalassococcus sp. S3]
MCGEELKGAQLLYNQYDGMLPLNKDAQGAKPLRNAVKAFDRLIEAYDQEQRLPSELVDELPEPIRFEVRQTASFAKGKQARDLIAWHRQNHDKLLLEQASRTNQRAYRAALGLRSIFDHYSEFPIGIRYQKPTEPDFIFPIYEVTASRVHGSLPSGRFMKALEAVFDRVNISATLHHYARLARDTPAEDPILVRNRHLMRRNLTDQTRDPFILTQFGWTKNSTVTDQSRELYEEFYSLRELRQCYRKYLKTNGSTTTPIKN